MKYLDPVRLILIDWLIDLGLTPFSTTVQSYHGGQFTYAYVSWFSNTSTPHDILSTQLAAFPHRLLAHWWKTNNACHSNFYQTSERILAELGFELGFEHIRHGMMIYLSWNLAYLQLLKTLRKKDRKIAYERYLLFYQCFQTYSIIALSFIEQNLF